MMEELSKETKEYFLKRLFELCKKSLDKKPQLEKPRDEQKDWFERKMRGSFV
jgi:hypothetical protein